MFGLQLTKEVTTEQLSPVEQQVESLRAKLSLPRSNALQLAEQNLAKLRSDRRDVLARQAAIIAKDQATSNITGGHQRISPEYYDLGREMDQLDAKITKARLERDHERERYGAKAREAIAGGVGDFRNVLLHDLNEIEQLIAVGIDLYGSAVHGGFELQNAINVSPIMREHVRAMRALLR